MKNVLICKKCGDKLGLKYEGTIEIEDLIREHFWIQINQIEKLNTKLNSCRSIINICAERLLDDESGALWAASDILQEIEDGIDEKISSLMQIYKQTEAKKAKKK